MPREQGAGRARHMASGSASRARPRGLRVRSSPRRRSAFIRSARSWVTAQRASAHPPPTAVRSGICPTIGSGPRPPRTKARFRFTRLGERLAAEQALQQPMQWGDRVGGAQGRLSGPGQEGGQVRQQLGPHPARHRGGPASGPGVRLGSCSGSWLLPARAGRGSGGRASVPRGGAFQPLLPGTRSPAAMANSRKPAAAVSARASWSPMTDPQAKSGRSEGSIPEAWNAFRKAAVPRAAALLVGVEDGGGGAGTGNGRVAGQAQEVQGLAQGIRHTAALVVAR